MHSRLFGFIATLIVFIFTTGAANAENWSRTDTKNFIVYSDGSPKSLEKAATDLERLDALMRQLLSIAPEDEPNRLEVYLVRSQNRVGLLADIRLAAGFYRPSSEGSIIVSHRQRPGPGRLSGQIVLFHEYAHHLMFRYFTNAYPAWYREGFAEYVSTTEFTDKGFTFGAPANHRAYSLLNGDYLPLEEILVPPDKKYRGQDRYMFYPQSWLLTHYMMADPDRTKSMIRYFEMLGQGDEPLAAAEVAFGDLNTLEKALERYGRSSIAFRKSTDPVKIDGTVTTRTLSELESAIVEADFHNRLNYKSEKTREDLRELIAAHPENADLHIQLAKAERNIAHYDETYEFSAAMAAVDRALELAPENEHAHVLKARLLLEPDDHPDEIDAPVDWKAVRKHAAKANSINPDNPQALMTYVESFTRKGGKVPEIAIPAMEQVFGTVPEAVNVRVLLAQLYARNGEFDRALRLVGFMVGDPHNPKLGRRLVANIEAMRDSQEEPPSTEPESDVKGANTAISATPHTPQGHTHTHRHESSVSGS